MSSGYPYVYPPDRLFHVGGRRISTTVVALALPVVVAALDVMLFGFPETGVPYNYPLFGDVVLVWLAVLFLRLSHRVLWNIGDEFATLIRLSRGNPVSLVQSLTPEDIHSDLQNVLYLAYHPVVLVVGAVLGGTFVSAIMHWMGVFEAYPYLGMNFGFGAAHGVFFGPVVGGAYVVVRAYTTYIADINLLDPNGVGGYRQIGNGIVKLATYAIGILTLDFVILSSVTFTAFERFQVVVSALFLLVLAVVVVGTVTVTVLVRRKLLQVRSEKVSLMRETFADVEREYWRKYRAEENNLPEALNVLSMYAMFYQMSDMDMWPINLYSVVRLGTSVSFSLAVYYLDLINSIKSLATLV